MKRKLFLYIPLAILFMVISCKKYNDLQKNDPLNNPSYLYGRLFLTDTLTQNLTGIPQSGKTVTVSYSDSTDPLNFLFSTTTDANGYFKFVNLSSKHTYRVDYMETVAGKIFTAETTNISLPTDQTVLNASVALTGQTGIIVNVKDTQGLPVNTASVCISQSITPYNNNTCDGSNYSLASDANGHASTFNVPPNTYYIFSKISINSVAYNAKATVTVVANQVATATVTLNIPAATPPKNGLNIVLLDAHGQPINGGTVCLFSSRILFARDTCEGSNYSTMTNATGAASLTNIAPGKYYVLGQVALTGFKLLARDSVTLNNSVLTDTLHFSH